MFRILSRLFGMSVRFLFFLLNLLLGVLECLGIVMLSREEHYGQRDDSDKDDETDADGFDCRNFSMSLRFLKEDIFILNFNWILRRICWVTYVYFFIHGVGTCAGLLKMRFGYDLEVRGWHAELN